MKLRLTSRGIGVVLAIAVLLGGLTEPAGALSLGGVQVDIGAMVDSIMVDAQGGSEPEPEPTEDTGGQLPSPPLNEEPSGGTEPPVEVVSSREAKGAVLACIRRWESDGRYGVVSPSGKYRGAYQFDLGTWYSVGGTGTPEAASKVEQDLRAWLLFEDRGLQPWSRKVRARC